MEPLWTPLAAPVLRGQSTWHPNMAMCLCLLINHSNSWHSWMNRKAVTTARPSCFPQPGPVSMHVTGCSMSLPSSVCSPFPPTTAPTFPSADWDLAGGYPLFATQPFPTIPTAPSPLQEAPDPRSLLQKSQFPWSISISLPNSTSG